jgi:hypothetical protein
MKITNGIFKKEGMMDGLNENQRLIADAVEHNRLAIEALRKLWDNLWPDIKRHPICTDTPRLFPPITHVKKK